MKHIVLAAFAFVFLSLGCTPAQAGGHPHDHLPGQTSNPLG